jgi:hypothetical protein
MPEFVSTLVLILFSKSISLFCDNNLSCDLINEEAQVFCLISIAFQFFIFRIFDKNFKTSFLELKQAGHLTFEKYFCCKKTSNGSLPQTYDLKNLRNFIEND